jgi:hypothetical protein
MAMRIGVFVRRVTAGLLSILDEDFPISTKVGGKSAK